ncbi:hypothetical protein PHISCL_06956 [Aspergillus sclerotialis]|uniref:Uncharacterized protein n=1 Tax=Aspergillus sclerotialis TaxID=2070753 RepID=A0A3A2ZUM6_9EURO|nr:hypothetical protein PHISCL_06956 [Aspergillus sclerotialis]
MQLLKLGALFGLAQTIMAGKVHIENTSPPANVYVHHCTIILDDPILGCSGSSPPLEEQCGRNGAGTTTHQVCPGTDVSVNWHTGQLKVKKGDQTAQCVLSDVKTGGHCNTDQPNEFEKGDYNAANSLSTSNALYGLAPLVAAGLLF